MNAIMRIGELSRRTGVSPELLRAWEQRYGLLRPTRSAGGFRLYSAEDEARVRRTAGLIAEGLSAAEAARMAVSSPGADSADERPHVEGLAAELRHALDGFDAAGAHAALDQLFGAVSVEFALTQVIVPYLHDLGERWASGEVSVAQEHFASNLVRGRLLGLTRDWGADSPSTVVLACMPGEAHDLGLVLLGVLIARRGWQVTLLGADTPFDTLEASIETLRPSMVVLSTYDADLFRAHTDALGSLAKLTRLAVLAPVPEQEVSDTGAQALVGDIAAAAAVLAAHS